MCLLLVVFNFPRDERLPLMVAGVTEIAACGGPEVAAILAQFEVRADLVTVIVSAKVARVLLLDSAGEFLPAGLKSFIAAALLGLVRIPESLRVAPVRGGKLVLLLL